MTKVLAAQSTEARTNREAQSYALPDNKNWP